MARPEPRARPPKPPAGLPARAGARRGAAGSQRHRVLVSTDIGGTDPDDFQSLVHLLVYADALDLEGLVASPYGPGRRRHILRVISAYAQDFERLRRHSAHYPTAAALRAITKQGALEPAPHAGFRQPTEGSRWIIRAARRPDPRPLHILVWGGLEDLAQALHDAPGILPKLRVYWIGGPNKKWSPDAYAYLQAAHRELAFVEANATYRGWFVGGDQSEQLSNAAFVAAHVAGHGALGDFFATQLGGSMKMGDTPSVAWLLRGDPSDPSQPGWGGRFVRSWKRPVATFDRVTTAADELAEFGILELRLPLGPAPPSAPEAFMDVENQALRGFADGDRMVFRFSPKASRRYSYSIRSNVAALAGLAGEVTALPTPPSFAAQVDATLPHWWTDDLAPELAEGPHVGAKTVSRWRRDFLTDFSRRMDRCLAGEEAEPTAPGGAPGL